MISNLDELVGKTVRLTERTLAGTVITWTGKLTEVYTEGLVPQIGINDDWFIELIQDSDWDIEPVEG